MLTEYAVTFITLEVVYIAIVAYVAYKTNNNIGTIAETMHLRRMEICFIIEAVSQLLWMLDYAGMWNLSDFMLWVVNLIYLCSVALCMYEWLCFIAEKVRFLGKERLTQFVLRLQTAAIVLHLLFILLSVHTHWIFYIDADGAYQRGDLFWVNIAFCYSNWAWTTFLIVANRRKASRVINHQLKKLLLISFLPVLAGILQFCFYNVPFLESSDMLSVLLVFTVLQDDQIKTDALTGLNNRAQFDRVYERMLSRADIDSFVIFVADIDRFKHINDTYGHLAGDRALLLVADGLRSLGKDHSTLGIFRYGGDEFVLLIPRKDIAEFEAFAREINEKLLQAEKRASLSFEVKFSVGYHVVDDSLIDGKKAFEAADRMLYDAKRSLPNQK